jgi:FkbM family methyltransferase
MASIGNLDFTNVLGHTFSRALLSGGNRIVIDCGANKGEFARYCAENLRARVISFEADPDLAELLPKIPGVTFENKAIVGRPGPVDIHQVDGLCSSARFHTAARHKVVTVPGVTLDNLFDEHGLGSVDLLKLDIEGAELDVLEGLSVDSLSRIRQISCEFHDFLNPADRPRIRSLLKRLSGDFVTLCMSVHTFGDVVLINRSTCVDFASTYRQLLLHKYCSGARRALSRLRRRG